MRPDATGFRRETKSEVMSQLRGLDGEVPVTPTVEGRRSEIEAEIDRLIEGLDSTVEVKVKVDKKTAEADLERVARAVKEFEDVKVEVKAKTKEAEDAVDKLAFKGRELREEFERLDRVRLGKVSDAMSRLEGVQSKIAAQSEKVRKAEEAVAEARARTAGESEASLKRQARTSEALTKATDGLAAAHERVAEARREADATGTAKARRELEAATVALTRAEDKHARAQEVSVAAEQAVRASAEEAARRRDEAVAKASAALRTQREELRKLEAAEAKAANAVIKTQEYRKDLEMGLGREIAANNKLLAHREDMLDKQLKLEEERIELARTIAELQTISPTGLLQSLEDQRREGEKLSDTLDRILARAGRLDDADFKALRDWAATDFSKSKVAHLRVEAETAMAEAELAALERTRFARVAVVVDSKLANLQQALKGLEGVQVPKGVAKEIDSWSGAVRGFIRSSTGIASISHMNNYLKVGMANMHGLSLASAAASVAIGTLSSVAVSSVGGLGSLAKGLIDISKGAVILPSALLAVGMGFATAKRGVSDFISAAKGNEDAMASLIEHSDEAATAAGKLFQVFSEADSLGKTAFFGELEGQVGRLGETLGPMALLWQNSYVQSGKFFRGVVTGLNDWFDSGDMSASVEQISEALGESSRLGGAFTNILTDMTDVGSKRLPAMARALSDVTEQYRDFIRESKDNGDMDKWLDEAGRQLKGLGSTLKSSVGILDAVGSAAKRAGYDGFVSLGRMAEKTEAALKTPLWQTGMSELFKGAADGSKLAGEGVKLFADEVMRASKPLGEMMEVSGGTVRELGRLSGLVVTHSEALSGLSEMGRDIQDSFEGSDRLFINLGDAMGQSSRVAGEVFKSFMGVADAIAAFWADGEQLTRGLEKAIPVLGDFAANLVKITHSLAQPLLDGLGFLLETFGDMPGAAQQAVLGIGLIGGALLLLKSRASDGVLAGFLNSVPLVGRAVSGTVAPIELMGRSLERTRGRVDSFRSGWVSGVALMGAAPGLTEARKQVGELDGKMSRLGGSMAIAATAVSGGFTTIRGAADDTRGSAERLRDGLGQIGSGMKSGGISVATGAINGLKGAMSGALALVGGPWGLAFIAAAGAIAYFTGKSKEAQATVDEYKSTLNSMGDSTAETTKLVSEKFNGMWEDFSVGMDRSSKRIGEVAEGTGFNLKKLSDGISEGGPAFDKYVKNLDDAAVALDYNGRAALTGSDHLQGYRDASYNLSEDQRALAEALDGSSKMTEEQSIALFGTADAAGMTAAELRGYVDVVKQEQEAHQKAAEEQKRYAESMGLSEGGLAKMSTALDTYNDKMADSATKAKAFTEILDVMTGGTRTFMNSAGDQARSMGALSSAFAKVREAGIGGADAFVQYTNALGKTSFRIDTARADLAGLDDAMQSSFDQTTAHAQATYDSVYKQTGSMEMAAAAANDVMSQWRSSAQAELVALGADAQQAEAYLNDLAGEPYMAEVVFMGKTEEFMTARAAVEEAGRSFDGEAFTAFLRANPGTTKDDIDALVAAGMSWSSSVYTSKIDADAGNVNAILDEITARGETFDAAEYEALMDGDESGFLDAVIASTRAGETLDGKEFRARFDMSDEDFQKVRSQAVKQGEELGSKEWVARLDMDNPGFAEKFYASQTSMEGLTAEEWWVKVQSNIDAVKQEQEGLYGSLTAMNGTSAEVSIVSNAATEAAVLEAYKMALDGQDGRTIQQTLKLSDEEFQTIIDALPGQWDDLTGHIEGDPADLKADDQEVNDAIEAARQKGSDWSDEEYKAKIDVDDEQAKSKLTAAGIMGSTFGSETYQADLDGNKEPFDSNVGEAGRAGIGFGTNRWVAMLDGNKSPFDTNLSLAGVLGDLFGLNRYTAALDGNKSPFSTSLGDASRAGSGFGLQSWSAILAGDPNKMIAAQMAAMLLGKTFSLASWSAKLGATTTGVTTSVGIARGIGGRFQGTTFTSRLSGNSGLMNQNTGIARGIGSRFQSSTFTSRLSGNGSMMERATGSARGTGNGFQRTTFTSRLSGNSSSFHGTVGGAMGQGRSFGWQNFRSTLSAANHASGTINYLFGQGWAWAGRVFTATFRAVSQRLGFDMGGIVKNGMRVFAKGAYIPSANVRHHARGSVTSGRHAPQIRYPQGPNVTVWNEGAGRGNTAGESYIPHAVGKRSRSTQILGLTAREFGLSVVKYNDGNITHVGGREAPGSMGAFSAPAPTLSSKAIVTGVRDGLSGASLSIGHGGEVAISMATERGSRRNNRR